MFHVNFTSVFGLARDDSHVLTFNLLKLMLGALMVMTLANLSKQPFQHQTSAAAKSAQPKFLKAEAVLPLAAFYVLFWPLAHIE